MKEKFANFFRSVKNFFLSLPSRLKPRSSARWIVVTLLWILILAYVGVGIFFGVAVYKNHADTPAVKVAVKIYPLPAAFVNGDIIWAKEYYKQMSYIKQYDLSTNATFSEPEIRPQLMAQLIDNHIIQWQAAKSNIKVSSKDVNDAYQKIVADKGEVEVQKVLKELYGMQVSDFKELIKIQVLQEKVQNDLIAQVKLAHIFTKDESKANEVVNKLKGGEDFAALAKTYSEDTKTRDSGGDLGWIARGNLVIDNQNVPEFETAAFAAKVGEVFGPVKTSVGFEIGRVDEKKGKVQKSYADWLNDARKGAKIIHFLF
jgi:foldase protein PrsA